MKLAIITIYRNDKNNLRHKQKKNFLHQIKFLQKYGKFDIFIIEQSNDNQRFNIGKLKNIGFSIAKNSNINYDFYIFTDIDILPDKILIPYYFKIINGLTCLATRGTRYNGKCFTGSCVGFNEKSFTKINGYPNNFWGWGGEDDVILSRCQLNNINIYIPKRGNIIDIEKDIMGNKLDIKTKLDNLKDKKENLKREKIFLDQTIWMENGLSNLNYKILNSKQITNNYYTLNHFIVDLKFDSELNIFEEFKVNKFSMSTYKKLIKKIRNCKYLLY